jgi:glycosyltransferase involved in cell wall biosynthesis
MKLVLVGDYPLKTACGGVGQYISCLASALASYQDIDVNVITYSNKQYVFREGNYVVHTVIRNTNIPKVLTIYSDTLNMEEEIRTINPDIVHVSGTYYPYNYLCKCIRNDYPLLVTLHAYSGNEIWNVPILHIPNSLINYVLEKRFLKSIKNIIVCSVSMKKLVQQKLNANIYVVPNGTDFTNIMKNENNYENDIKHPSILFLGRLEKIKGIEVLIKAIPEIKKKIPDIHVYLAGEGSRKNWIIKLIRELNIDNNVTFLGYITGYTKYFYIKNADLFVAPSYYESFGLSILEAMACGKAIVASNVDNVPYLIEDGKEGILIRPSDSQELANGCIQVLLNPNYGKLMGANAKQKAESYTWNDTAKMTYKLYQKILNTLSC